MTGAASFLERQQVVLYLVAIVGGAAAGLVFPTAGQSIAWAITPTLGLLLYVTFLGIPFARIASPLRDARFLVTVLVTNVVAVPCVVFGLTRFVAHDQAVLLGLTMTLLTPCVDYVIVFTGLAGGSRERLLAVTPVLMLAQLVLLPLGVWLIAGAAELSAIEPRPFINAFVWLIVVPMAAAAATQWLAMRTRGARVVHDRVLGAMVPLMMITLAVVVASQIAHVATSLDRLLPVLPISLAFAIVAGAIGAYAGRVARLDAARRRAVIFSTTTRNSLVVLPLALALPASFALTPLVVVTQTLVELIVMVVMVALVPRLVTDPDQTGRTA